MNGGDAAAAFLDAAVWHGPRGEADAILAANPGVATSGIHAAAVLGREEDVRRFLAEDAANAVTPGGPRGWDPLTYLCFSKYLRIDRARSAAFVRCAEALLDAGASARTGFFAADHQPEPEFESALYGAAGVAHHAPLTRLLIARGADVNDVEVAYHAPETWDNETVRVLVDSGRMTADSLAIMLVRKHDWHDFEGVTWLLERGADPNRPTRWGRTPLQHAVLRDNAIEIVEAVLAHAGDPARTGGGISAMQIAARRGRGDLLTLFIARGVAGDLSGTDALIAACARGDRAAASAISTATPDAVRDVVKDGPALLTSFAGNDNADGVECLIELGVDVAAPLDAEDSYWNVAPGATALHVAAWRAAHRTVGRLIARGAPVNARDSKGQSPLMLAVRACVDSYWMRLRSPESVAALLDAGASTDGVPRPCGYAEVDALLASRG